MKRVFAKLFVASITLVSFLIGASDSLMAKNMATLRLNLEGPFVVCEDVEVVNGKSVPILRVIAPNEEHHYNPGFSADSSQIPDPPIADAELKNKGAEYRVKIDNYTPSGSNLPPPVNGPIDLDRLPSTSGSCNVKNSAVLLSVILPMPDHIRPFAPVRADPNFTPPCDDKEAAGSTKNYGTKLALIYDKVDVDAIDVCQTSDCNSNSVIFRPKIDTDSGVGVLVLHMLQKTSDPNNDHHRYAKKVHKPMRTIAAASNHCVHFEKGSRGEDANANFFFHGHTDCGAPLMFVCAKSSSVVCSQ